MLWDYERRVIFLWLWQTYFLPTLPPLRRKDTAAGTVNYNNIPFAALNTVLCILKRFTLGKFSPFAKIRPAIFIHCAHAQ